MKRTIMTCDRCMTDYSYDDLSDRAKQTRFYVSSYQDVVAVGPGNPVIAAGMLDLCGPCRINLQLWMEEARKLKQEDFDSMKRHP